MMKWPSLWLPPLLINALQTMPGGAFTNSASQGIVAVTSNLGAFMVQAGWLAMIVQALKQERPKMADFKSGVNAHWGNFVAGNVAYLVLLGLMLAATALIADSQYGFGALRDWYGSLKDLTTAQLQAALVYDKLPAPVRGWFALLLGWFVTAVLVTFLLVFWQPLVATRDMAWWNAWGASVRLIFTRFGQVLSVAMLQLTGFFMCFSLVGMSSPFTVIMGLTLFLFVVIYFKIVYAAIVSDAFGPPATVVDLQA